jgi:hypothetical protein
VVLTRPGRSDRDLLRWRRNTRQADTPNLETETNRLVADLTAQPRVVPVIDPAGATSGTLTLTEARLQEASLFAVATRSALLPRMLHEAAGGDVGPLVAMLERLASERKRC